MPIAVLLLTSHFFFWPSVIDWQTYQENVAVRGTVVDERSGRPIAGAVVEAISGADVARARSDSKGHFIFLALLPGTYSLSGSKLGYDLRCDGQPEELFAGFEYGATLVLTNA
jgi:Carboxypeptidase regulatory-like domain